VLLTQPHSIHQLLHSGKGCFKPHQILAFDTIPLFYADSVHSTVITALLIEQIEYFASVGHKPILSMPPWAGARDSHHPNHRYVLPAPRPAKDSASA
jgi:hypothetical protein